MLDARDSEVVDEKGGGLKPTLQSSPSKRTEKTDTELL